MNSWFIWVADVGRKHIETSTLKNFSRHQISSVFDMKYVKVSQNIHLNVI